MADLSVLTTSARRLTELLPVLVAVHSKLVLIVVAAMRRLNVLKAKAGA